MNESTADPKMEKKCPQCGTPLTAGGLAGLCPACLLKQAATETATQPDAQKFKPPTVEELARLFPQLEILSLIGKGGMGAVYKARQPMLDRIVALKILPAQVTLGTDFGDRFTREARALAKLNHPNIVMVYEFGQLNGQPYFIMEYVDGLNLRQLEQEGKLTPREALLIVPQICEALQFAHDAGIVHRDIKPDNILLDKKGRVKIADFGIAKILGTAEDPAIPVTQGAIGTPHYMAPEQVEKPQTVDHRADIFSLGVVFYEMLTGELPLGKFAAPSSGPRGLQVDVRLDEVVLRALERKPELRYQHASQVKTAVENIASTQLGGAAGAHPHVQAPEALLAQDYILGIRRSLRRGWALVKKNFWPLVGMTMLILALMCIADSAFTSSHHEANGVTTEGLSVLALLLNGPLLAGLFFYFLKKIRGEAATVETAFAGFFSKRFLHLFLAHFVVTALTVLGFLCLILPGIYLMVAWSFTLALILDTGLDFWPAMELSRKMINRHWWKMLLFLLVMAGVLLAGILCCLIGIFIAAPVAIAAFMYAYEDVFGTWTPANSSTGQPFPVTPTAHGPAGTMVVPNAAGTPPSAGITPPPITSATPTPPGNGSSQWLKYGLVGAVGLAALITVVALLPSFKLKLSNLKMAHDFGVANFHEDESRNVMPTSEPAPPENVANPAYVALVERTRQELGKISVQFDELQLTSGSDSNLVVSFDGLRKQSPTETNPTAPGGIMVSNERAAVSSSMDKGIQVTDKKNHDHTSISFPGLHISVNNEQENSGQDIDGTLVGARLGVSNWQFTGTGELAAVRFAVTNQDLEEVLAAAEPPAPPEAPEGAKNSREKLAARLTATETITDESIKDKSLTSLAKDAAKAGDTKVVKSALDQMVDTNQRDAAMSASALLLAKTGFLKPAIELARTIADDDIRDKTLAELAQ
jgi:predicted Ser/Thr protein kinase